MASISTSRFVAPPQVPACISWSTARASRSWARVNGPRRKYGGRGRRGWKKLHLGVDRSGVIVARALTEASVDDATTGITLIEAVDGALGRVTADTAYDTVGFYEAAGARGATVVVPPTRTAHVSRYGPRSGARDRTILAVKETRTATLEEDVGLSWAGPRGERVLPIHVDHRRQPSSVQSRRAGD